MSCCNNKSLEFDKINRTINNRSILITRYLTNLPLFKLIAIQRLGSERNQHLTPNTKQNIIKLQCYETQYVYARLQEYLIGNRASSNIVTFIPMNPLCPVRHAVVKSIPVKESSLDEGFNKNLLTRVKCLALEKLDSHFEELLHMFKMMRQWCFDVCNKD